MIHPTTHVASARPVEKSRACLTAITPAMSAHTETAKAIRVPRNGMKEKKLSTLGELEKPMVLKSSPYVADVSGPLNTLVPSQ